MIHALLVLRSAERGARTRNAVVLRGAHLHLRQELDTLRAVRVDLSHVRGLRGVACGKDKGASRVSGGRGVADSKRWVEAKHKGVRKNETSGPKIVREPVTRSVWVLKKKRGWLVASRPGGWAGVERPAGGAARAPRARRGDARARARGAPRRSPRSCAPYARARSPRAEGGARREPRICRLEASVYVAREEADEPCARSGRVRTCAESTLSKVKASPSAAKEATPDARSATTPTTPQTPATAATTRERVVVDCFLKKH